LLNSRRSEGGGRSHSEKRRNTEVGAAHTKKGAGVNEANTVGRGGQKKKRPEVETKKKKGGLGRGGKKR